MTAASARSKNKRNPTITEAINAGAYKKEIKLEDNMAWRAARFLDWAARKYPKQSTPYNYMWKAINGFKKTPRLDSEDVERFRSSMSRVRRVLQDNYGRDLWVDPGIGVRATTDSNDIVDGPLEKASRRVIQAQSSASRTASLVDPRKLNAANKAWFNDVQGALRKLASPAIGGKLLREAKEDRAK